MSAAASHRLSAPNASVAALREVRRVRDIVNAIHFVSHAELPHLLSSHHYWKLKEELVLAEQRVLRTLAFGTRAARPQVLLLNCLRLFGGPPVLWEVAVALLNDSAINEACALPSRTLVAAVLALGEAMLKLPLPAGWQGALEVDAPTLSAACHAILNTYDGSIQC